MAFLAHQAAVFRDGDASWIPLANLWKDDSPSESMPVVSGSVQVPEGPGLGLKLDRQKYEKYGPPPGPIRDGSFPGSAIGTVPLFTFGPARSARALRTGSSDLPGPVPGYGNAVLTDHWMTMAASSFEVCGKRRARDPYGRDGRGESVPPAFPPAEARLGLPAYPEPDSTQPPGREKTDCSTESVVRNSYRRRGRIGPS